jgi:anti-sigma factor RsiW
MTMCDRVDAFADGEVPLDERPAFHDHLAACASCQDALWRALLRDALAEGSATAAGIAAPPGWLPIAGRNRAKPHEKASRQDRSTR